MIDFFLRAGKNCYPLVFLEEFKNVVKETKVPNKIMDHIEISPDSDRENSDEENFEEEN